MASASGMSIWPIFDGPDKIVVAGVQGVEGRVEDKVTVAPGEKNPSKSVVSAKTLVSNTAGSNTSSMEGKESKGSGYS